MSNAEGTVSSNAPSARPGISFESTSAKPCALDDSPIQPENTDVNMAELPSDLAQSCLAVIEERCQGLISLAQVTLQLMDLLPDNDASNEAYGSYLDQLTKLDHERVIVSSRGHNTNEAVIALSTRSV